MTTLATQMQRNPAPRILSSGPCWIRSNCPVPCAPLEKTMTKDTKIPQAARNFVDRFGKDAPAEAKQRANELQQVGNAEGHKTWMLIYEQVKRLVEDRSEGLKH